jgi:hypothetical protein
MARVAVLLIVVVVVVFAAAFAAAAAGAGAGRSLREVSMSQPIRTVAFALLWLLLMGAATGLLVSL